MSISTYDELQTAIANWTHRTDLTSRIPEFITIGEARIGREVRSKEMEQRASSTPTTQYLSLPSDFIAMRAVRIKGSEIGWLDYVTPDDFFASFASSSVSSSKAYTIFGDELILPKAPGADVELWYFKKLAALSSAVNNLFSNNPDLYLYAALCAAAPFVGKDAKTVLWESLYTAVKDQLNKSHKEGRFPGAVFVKAVS